MQSLCLNKHCVASVDAGCCCWLVLLVLVTARSSDAAFLQNQLPFEVVLTTPSALLDNGTEFIKVEDGQAFMVSSVLQHKYVATHMCQLAAAAAVLQGTASMP
jgi:hypothetical protein